MKKLVLGLALITGMAFATVPVQAQDNDNAGQEKQENTQKPRTGFVDKDGDGVCDNYDGNRPGKGLGPGNGNGKGRANGKGLGRGQGQGAGQGRGGGGNFVDSNDNGVCDNLEDGTGRQQRRDGSGGGTGQGND
ncbi:MAG: hypothetical protein R6U46_11435 [Marinilabilia sp.]